MRDAIVFSGGGWEAFNVMERVALALSRLGARILYCENTASVFKERRSGLREVEPGIFTFQPHFWGHRLNYLPLLQHAQAGMVAAQIFDQAEKLVLREPLFIFPMLARFLPLCAVMKKRCFAVHVQMDHIEWDSEEHVRLSDLTLAIPRSVFHKLRAAFGDKVRLIPQVVDFQMFVSANGSESSEPSPLASIPRPRLGYLGPAHNNLNLRVLAEVLRLHPEWHFVSCGDRPALPLPNAHVVPWQGRQNLPACVRSTDVAFLPYDCANEQRLHCVPLKLFESFALGLPVVSTPLIHLWEFKDVIYFGETPLELAAAVDAALRERPDSPRKAQRIEIARNHSIECLASALAEILPLRRDRHGRGEENRDA